MRDPYIVRRKRTGIETGYLKRITELEEKNELLEGRVKEFEIQILGLLGKYYDVYERFPDLQEARKYAVDLLNENGWHNLQKNPADLPQCEENEQIIFYVKEWFEEIQKYRTHYCLGFYKKAFLNDEVKLFVERSKGYENEHLPKTVIRWRELKKWEME